MTDITSKIYLGLPTSPVELLTNGDFELVTGDDFDDWTEVGYSPAELLLNPDMENFDGVDDFTSWEESIAGTGTIEDETVEYHAGSHSAKITAAVGPNGGNLYQEIAVAGPKNYVLMGWVKGDYNLTLYEDLGLSDDNISGNASDWEEKILRVTVTGAASLTVSNSLLDAVKVSYLDDMSVVEDLGLVHDSPVVHAGSHAVKLVGTPDATQPYIHQTAVSDPGDKHRLSFWSKGDGSNGVAYQVYDVTNGAVIASGNGTTSTTYTETVETYNVPASCVSIKITFTGVDGAVAYLDDVSLLEYGPVNWVENEDVLAVPAPSWGYGLGGKDPLRGVADTGAANFSIENDEGKYSPENPARITGFEEGMPVKIIVGGDIDPSWNQEADLEEGDLTDFDAVTPTWDGEVNAVADFDSETDADGDMFNAPVSGHIGGPAIAIVFDDANAAYGVMNASAVNQPSGVITFWFDTADVAIEAGKYIELGYLFDGGGGVNWIIRYNANDTITVFTLDDSPAYSTSNTSALGAGYYKIDVHFKVSTGAGNNDGYTRIYVDDVLVDEDTGIDNDTLDWDYLRIGMVSTPSTTFSGGYFLESIKIDPVGAPFADTLAAQNGTYGMSIPIMDTTSRYVSFTDPTAETRITSECNFDLNSLTMANGDAFQIMTNSVDIVYLAKDAGGYYLRLLKGLDAGNTWGTQGAYITDANHHIRLVSGFSTGAANDDGYYKIYVDDVLYTSETGLDNDTKTAETVYFGAIGPGAGTYGIIHFDDCRWADEEGLVKFLGTMVDIDPSSGVFDNPVTTVVAHDWIGYLNKQELGVQAIQSDKRVDEALTTILTEFPNQPEDTDFDTGVETFEIIFAGDSGDSSMARMFAKLARNERGRIFSEGDGTLRFEKQGTRDGSQDSAFTIDGTMSEFDVTYSSNNIYNTVALDVKTQIVDAAATTELFKVGQGVPITAGQTITITCNFTDPDTGQSVAGSDVVTPVAAPHFGSVRTPASDDMNANLTHDNYQVGGSAVTVDLNNNHATDTGYLNEFTILGKRITDYDKITITKKNQASIDQVGNSKYTNRLDLIEDPTVAEDIADGILTDYAPSHTSSCRITVLANTSDTLAQALITAEPGTKFTAIESITGISKDFYIDNIRYKQDHTLLWVTIEAEEA